MVYYYSLGPWEKRGVGFETKEGDVTNRHRLEELYVQPAMTA